MEQAQALRFASELFAAFPGRSIAESHIIAFAEAFMETSVPVAVRAVARLRATMNDPPSLAFLLATIRELSEASALPEAALCAHGRSLEGSCDECDLARERFSAEVRKLEERWASEDVNLRDAYEDFRIATRDLPRSKNVCSGAGKYPILLGDRWCCPDCKEPIP